MGIGREFILSVTAAAALRIPAFVYPIAAVRVLGFGDYTVFAAHYVFAGAIGAFAGEAIAATVSRAAASAAGAQAARRLVPLSLAVALCGACLIVGAAAVYLGLSGALQRESGEPGVLAWQYVALLSPGFFLNPPLLALANLRGDHLASAAWAVAWALLVMVLPLFAGASGGAPALFVVHGALTLAIASALIARLCGLRAIVAALSPTAEMRAFLSGLAPILLSMSLGGPVHGLCLYLLASSPGGVPEMAVFVAYYPWSVLIAFFASVQSNFVIQRVARAHGAQDRRQLGRMVAGVLGGNLGVALALALALLAVRDPVLGLYGEELPARHALFAMVLACGVASAAYASANQVVVSLGWGRLALFAAALYALAYCATTAIVVVRGGHGAFGLAATLFGCLLFFVTLYAVAIWRGVALRARGARD